VPPCPPSPRRQARRASCSEGTPSAARRSPSRPPGSPRYPRGGLCFIEANWPLIGGSFVIDGVDVLWPNKAAEHLLAPGDLDEAMTERVYRLLAAAFPLA